MTTPTPPAPVTPRTYSLRKRVIGGGIVAGLVGLGIWLANQLGLGLGGGAGPGGGDEGDSGAQVSSDETDNDEESSNADRADEDTGEETLPTAGQPPLRVLVSGTDYQAAWTGEEEFVPATLEEIVQIAVNMSLEPDKRRVLILHTPTGESGPYHDLRRALGSAGLTELQFDSAAEPFSPAPQ